MKLKAGEIHFRGIPMSEGIAIGNPVFMHFIEDSIPEYAITQADIKTEIQRYRKALEKARNDVSQLKERLIKEKLLDAAEILEAHLQIMQDPIITSQVEKKITETRKNAEYVFHSLIEQYKKKFNGIKDPIFRDKFKDVEDVSHRILLNLKERTKVSLAQVSRDSIVFARELSTSDIAEANGEFVKGFVTETGSMASHATIVARTKGIPLVTHVAFDKIPLDESSLVIVDGRNGDVFFNSSEETAEKYSKLQLQLAKYKQDIPDNSEWDAETYDGYSVGLSANVEMASELDVLHQYGCNGVGLYRSEFVFLSYSKFPTEDEQFQIYRAIVEKMHGLPIVFRVFDLGGDKFINGQEIPRENNPFLGCRAIRFLLQRKELFKSQLRAIVRASSYGDISILFPMVSTLSELIEAKELLFEAQREIAFENKSKPKSIRIGCMIEVPSAAIIADLLAKECDFISIGTNDLVQYSLAVDRGNQAMSGLYSPAHPGVLRLIKLIVNEANHHGIPVTVCGEIAAEPKYIPLLLGLGVHELSVASRAIPLVKEVIRNTSIVEASQLADRILQLSTAQEIHEALV